MNKPPAIALLLVAALLTSCASSSSDSPSPADSESPTASSTPEETPTEPVAREYTDAELIAALPRSAREFYGLKITSRCLRMDRECPYSTGVGKANVTSFITGGKFKILSLSVFRDPEPRWQRPKPPSCAPGPYTNPAEPTSDGGFNAGQRGVATSEPFEAGGWKGSICTKRHRATNLDSEQFGPTRTEKWLYLSSSHHSLVAQSMNNPYLADVVTDYLDRLEGQ